MIRISIPALPLLALLFTSCANEGVVVQKNSQELPFYHTLGVDGSYKLALRDNSGAVHSQLVTPEVYQDYAQGDYFNDTQPPLNSNTNSADVKDTVALRPAPPQTLASHGIGNGKRLAGNAGGNGRTSSTTATRRAVTNARMIASAPTAAVSAPAIPKPAIPVVAAHFALPVPPSASVQAATVTGSEASPIVRSVAMRAPTAPSKAALKPVAPRFAAQTNTAQKLASNQTARAQVSRRSYHVASAKVPATAKVAVSSTKVIPSNHVAFVTQKVATQPETATQSKSKKAPQKTKHVAP